MAFKDAVKMTSIEGQRCGVNGGQDKPFKIDSLLNSFGMLYIHLYFVCNLVLHCR